MKNSKQETSLCTFIDKLERKRESAQADARTSKSRDAPSFPGRRDRVPRDLVSIEKCRRESYNESGKRKR